MTAIGPLLRRSSGPFFRRFLAAALLGAALGPAAAGQGLAGAAPPDSIELELGYGFGVPSGSVLFSEDPGQAIQEGLDLDHLIRRVLIQRALRERLLAEIDYDSLRNSSFSLLGGNLYSLSYRGEEGEFLRELSIGNKYLSIPGTRWVPIDAGNPQTFALRAGAELGRFRGNALLRYGVSQEGRRSFRGSRRLLESRLLDVQYARGRFFLLPDAGLDEPGLKVYRTTTGTPDRWIDGKPFVLLARQADYLLDNARGRLSLRRALAAGEELAVGYTKGGVPVGSALLGQQAIVEPSGLRADFGSGTHPQYFDDGLELLYLKKSDLNSYWEMCNAYVLEELAGGEVPAELQVSLSYTGSGAANENYAGLLERFSVDTVFAALLFDFRDAAGFYPRPFPGQFPFYNPDLPPPTPGNPFAADNPVYGGLGYPVEENSVNTLRIRYTVSTDSFFLDYDLVENSVQVTVDGARLNPSAFSVDYDSGLLRFAPGVLGPASEVEVTYRFTPGGAGESELFAALRLGADLGPLQTANLTTYNLPLLAPPAPLLGEEKPSSLANSTELSLRFGDAEAQGWQGELEAGAAVSLSTPNSRGLAVVADMESGRRYRVSVRDSGWTLGSRSQLLPAAVPAVPLQSRGELRYENYWERRLLGGDLLRTLDWDNSGNPQFDYSRKAGPYNTADHTGEGEDRSLVLDFSFPAAADEAFVSTVTALPGANLSGYTHLNVLLRGDGVSGGAVRLYAELLQTYQEDLDGDDTLDGESSSAQPGFAITPLGGQSTVLGSDRLGEDNGRLDSEDLDSSGTLDPPGPFAGDQEQGVLLASPAGPLATLDPGDGGWQRLTLDLGGLAAASPAAFQRAKALRLTLTPAVSPTAAPVSGRLLVNGIWFSVAGPQSTDASRLSLREGADSSFSEDFPEVYEELHGRASYREDQGLEEQSLQVRFLPPLSTGEEAGIRRRFSVPADFSPYREFRMYVYLPAGQSFPAAAGLSLEFLSSAQEKYAVELAPAAFAEGWNEVQVSLEPPYPVRVRGASAGALARTGALEVWRTVTEVRFGIRAAGGDLTEAFEFRLDEWHLRGSRWAAEAGVNARARFGYAGALLEAGGFQLLSDAFLSGGLEWAQGSLARQPGRRLDRWSAGLEARLLSVLPVALQLAGSGSHLEEATAGGSAAFAGFAEGTESRTYSQRLGLDTGSRWVPVVEHTYQRSELGEDAVALTREQYSYQRAETVSETLGLSARWQPSQELEQTWAYSRSWAYQRQREAEEGEALPALGQESLGLTERLEGRLRWRHGDAGLQIDGRREDLLATVSPAPPPGLGRSYAEKLATFFRPAAEALPGAWRSGRTDRVSLSLDLPRARYLGCSLDLGASYGELNAEPAAGTRDAIVRGELSLALPFSPDGRGLLELTPLAARLYSGSFRRVEGGLEEAQLLGQCLLPLAQPPFHYAPRGNEYPAVDTLRDDGRVLGGSTAAWQGSVGLEGRLREAPWYLPSRAGVLATGDTSRDGASYAQKRSLRFTIGKELAARAPGGSRFSVDASWVEGWDYANKVRSRGAEAAAWLRLSGRLPGTLEARHTLRYARERQRAGEEELYLFPGDPGGELAPPFRPDSDTVLNRLDLRYRWEQPVVTRASRLRSLLRGGSEVQRLVHEEHLEVESEVVATDRSTTTLSETVPLRVALTHQSRLVVDQGVELGFSLKALGGVQELIERGSSTWKPALGIELRLSARLEF